MKIRIKLIIIPFIFMSMQIFGQMPPHPDLLKKIRNREIETPYLLKHLNELRKQGIDAPSPVSILKAIEAKRAKMLYKGSAAISFNILAVCVDFSDRPFKTDPAYFDELLFSQSKSNSLYNYLKEATYGKVLITSPDKPGKIGKVMADKPYSYYCGTNSGANVPELVGEIVAKIDPIVNFSNYDNNGDGNVDCLFIIHSGPGAEMTGNDTDIWSNSSGIPVQFRDGVSIRSYSTEPEYWSKPGDMTCGVYAHEMGHTVFGLPDLYDYNADNGSSEGLGNWSVMASGCWNGTNGDSPAYYDAWCKSKMGVVIPQNISADTIGLVIKNIEDTTAVYKVWKDGVPGKEYFLLENRQLKGFDSKLPGKGLLIYHIDESQPSNGDQWYPGHTSDGNYMVALEQADGLWDLERRNNYGDSGDPYPGALNQKFFNDITSPNTQSYSNTSTNIAISNITDSATQIIADISLSDALHLSSTKLDLGIVEVSNSNNNSIITVKNTGTTPINIANINNYNPRIVIKTTATFPLNILKNESIDLNISFTPTYKGSVNDSILINYSISKPSTKIIPLTAYGYVIKPVLDSVVYCSDNQGSILTISPFTGVAIVIGKSGFPRVKSLALSRKDKTLYGLAVTSTETDLIKINGQEGDGYKFLKLNKPVSVITFDSAGVLYGVSDYSGFYKINLSTGVCDSLGSTGFNTTSIISGLAVNPLTNQLFASIGSGTTNPDAIYKLNLNNGMPTLVGNTGFKTFTSCIAFDNNGNLVGIKSNTAVSGNLIRIDANSDVGSLLSFNNYSSIEGLAAANSGLNSGVSGNSGVTVSNKFDLEQNYPNPFNPVTTINYVIPKDGIVKLAVYDILGREIATLVNETQNAGKYSIHFNASHLSSGIYFYSLKTNNYSLTKKMAVLK
jgi:M6 family metalloprotease-like protein